MTTKEEFESKFRHLDSEPKRVYSVYSIAEIWQWIEKKLIEAKIEEINLWIEFIGDGHTNKLVRNHIDLLKKELDSK